MAPEKRNRFLDADDSEDDVQDYNSEDEMQKGGRIAKRRKTQDESDFDEEDASDASENEGSDSEAEEHPETVEASKNSEKQKDDTKTDEDSGSQDEDSSAKQVKTPQLAKALTKKNLVATEAAIKKSGVVYLSRIPPFMKPGKLRFLLERYGKINRLFLAPQDPTVHSRRVRAGGNRKKMYTEGWVEFVRKKDAKAVCEMLNAQTIGGKKGSYYRDDIWTLMYLKGFKWHNLTEQIAAENAERSNRMMAEISRTTRENKEFMRNVEKAKVQDGMQAKRAQKKKKQDASDGDAVIAEGKSKAKPRTFQQLPLAKRGEPVQPSELKNVASRIF